MAAKTFVNGVLLAAMAVVPMGASAQQCPPAPPPGAIEQLNLEAHRVRSGETSAQAVSRALRSRALQAGTDPETLRRVTNAMAAKAPGETDEEAAAAAVGVAAVPPIIIATGACMLATVACMNEAYELQEACLEQNCPAGTVLDPEKCGRIASSDVQHCWLSCGANMPDNDFGRACVKAPSLPPAGPFIPPTPIPPTYGGFSVECTEAQMDACEVQSGTYTDTSTGNIVDRQCTFYSISGDLSRCTCSCIEVVAVSEEMVFESE